MTRQSVFSIAPHAPFLKTLAERVLDGTLLGDWPIDGPFGLSDITIILPTQRAQTVLARHFADLLGGAALLPDIRTLGGAPEEEEPFLPPFDTAPLPRAIQPLQRKLLLAELVEGWAKARSDAAGGEDGFSTPPSAAEILGLAESLAELIDDFHVEGNDARALKAIVPEDLAGNWQATVQFLEIAFAAWPNLLMEMGRIDGADRRNRDLKRRIAALPLIYGNRPVIAAGSTGSIPAAAELLKAVSALPRGALILPGFDTNLSPDQVAALTNVNGAPHGHPQYGLAQLLNRLGKSPADIVELAELQAAPRTILVRTALALPEETANWAKAREAQLANIPQALDGMSVLVAATDDEQARGTALAARAALAGGKSVGIVAPDRNFARRLVAELNRFDIAVDDSAGIPLFQSRAGRLVRQLLAVIMSDFGPVDLMALLRNQYTVIGLDRATITKLADSLDFAVLRGQPPLGGIVGLKQAIADNLSKLRKHVPQRLDATGAADLTALLDRLEMALHPLETLCKSARFSASQFAAALQKSLVAIIQPAETDETKSHPEDLKQLLRWTTALAAETVTGPVLSTAGLDHTLDSLMAGTVVRAPVTGRDDIAIWGQLEARLQVADLMILCGLSEGIWPEPADPGAWLSRGVRLAAGLEPPERRQGQAAHDFEMAIGNRETLITRAERVGTAPANPSRLLQRIEAFIGPEWTRTLIERGACWVEQARQLDLVADPKPAKQPMHTPPAAKRPKNLSITEIETLIRSPYDLYAKYTLGLRAIDPLGADPDRRERGTLFHEVFEAFVTANIDPTSPDVETQFMGLAEDIFAKLNIGADRKTIWFERFRAVASAFLDFERARQANVLIRHAECKGELIIPIGGVDFTLRGRADRIDEMKTRSLEIMDFKTGSIPDKASMKDFTAPQLLLEAHMAREGAFVDIPDHPASALTYIKVGGGTEPLVTTAYSFVDGMDINTATDEVMRRLASQVEAYLLDGDRPMAARIFPNPKQTYRGDYDHLARLGEWASADGEDVE